MAAAGDRADTGVLLRRRDERGVLHLTLNRPELRNAMNAELVHALRAALAEAEAATDVRAIVLRGAGGHFCAGADLKSMAATPRDPASMAALNASFGELCVAYANTPLATVAVLEGTVMGGGFGLACVADVAIASQTVAFRLPETSIGVVPAQIAPFLVERLGYSEAKRLAVTGGRIDAATALSLRLVHEVHASDEIESALRRLLDELLQCAPGAVAATKALIAKARFTPPATLVPEAAQVFAKAATGPEGIEGALAFVQKRKPRWAP